MTALNSEGLEKARDAFYGGPGQGFVHPPFDALEAAITAYLSALPPVDGLEVVAWLTPYFESTLRGQFVPQIITREAVQEGRDDWKGLVTLSQASSVIAGLRKERITAERDALDAYGKLQAAEARISSLEEENKRLREAIDEIADFDDPDAALDPNVIHLIRIAGAARRSARQTLGDHNG